MAKTIQEINEKIRKGQVVVVDAEEVIEIVAEKGAKKAAQEVDVVTTGTFGPMCSSGAFLNTGHTKPRCKFARAWLNNINAYAGLAAVDVYIGATELPVGDPANSVFPGKFEYGGGRVMRTSSPARTWNCASRRIRRTAIRARKSGRASA